MTEEYKVGGISTMFGIEFQGEKYSASIDLAKNKIDVSENPVYSDNKVIKFIKKIPFVRGVVMILIIFLRLFYMVFKTNKMVLFLVVGFMAYVLFAPHDAVPVQHISYGFFWDNYSFFFLSGAALIFIWSVRNNHTIEHKIISAFTNGRDLSLENIKKQPKENKRCGGVMAAWLLILMAVLKLLFVYPQQCDFLLISVAYEFFMVAQMNNFLGSMFYAPGWLIQKLTTAKKVSDENILKAREAFVQLLQKENQGYIL